MKKLEYHENGKYFLSLISESETQILYRFITYRVKYYKPLFLEILKIMVYRHKIMAYRQKMYIRSIKKGYFKQMSGFWKVCSFLCTQYLVGPPFAWTCINAACHGVNQSVALLGCNGSPGCFDSGLQVICTVGSGVSYLPLNNTP